MPTFGSDEDVQKIKSTFNSASASTGVDLLFDLVNIITRIQRRRPCRHNLSNANPSLMRFHEGVDCIDQLTCPSDLHPACKIDYVQSSQSQQL